MAAECLWAMADVYCSGWVEKEMTDSLSYFERMGEQAACLQLHKTK